MTFRSFAVHAAPTRDGLARLELAAALARDFDARLIGLGVVDAEETAAATAGLPRLVLEQRRRDFGLALGNLENRFLSTGSGLRTEWRSALAPTVAYCAAQSRTADLLIAGRRPEDEPSPGFRLDPTALLMRLGRPLLLVPPEVGHLSADRVVVAWKATREARLVTALALPFLIRAGEVLVIGVGDEVERAELEDVADLLRLHNVPADVEHHAAKAPAAQALIELATGAGADLIVAGGFRRGPIPEWVLGGVTRGLLTDSPVCCLMAH